MKNKFRLKPFNKRIYTKFLLVIILFIFFTGCTGEESIENQISNDNETLVTEPDTIIEINFESNSDDWSTHPVGNWINGEIGTFYDRNLTISQESIIYRDKTVETVKLDCNNNNPGNIDRDIYWYAMGDNGAIYLLKSSDYSESGDPELDGKTEPLDNEGKVLNTTEIFDPPLLFIPATISKDKTWSGCLTKNGNEPADMKILSMNATGPISGQFNLIQMVFDFDNEPWSLFIKPETGIVDDDENENQIYSIEQGVYELTNSASDNPELLTSGIVTINKLSETEFNIVDDSGITQTFTGENNNFIFTETDENSTYTFNIKLTSQTTFTGTLRKIGSNGTDSWDLTSNLFGSISLF